jgi:hypothetical protein
MPPLECSSSSIPIFCIATAEYAPKKTILSPLFSDQYNQTSNLKYLLQLAPIGFRLELNEPNTSTIQHNTQTEDIKCAYPIETFKRRNKSSCSISWFNRSDCRYDFKTADAGNLLAQYLSALWDKHHLNFWINQRLLIKGIHRFLSPLWHLQQQH